MTPASSLPPVVGGASRPVVYATIGSRFGAYFLDTILTVCAVLPGYACIIVAGSAPYQVNGGMLNLGLLLLLASPVFAIYQWRLVAKEGASVGKRMVGIRIVDETSGEPIGWGRAFLRQLVLAMLTGLSCGILGLISIMIANGHPRRQGWHDSAAHTVVVVGKVTSGGTAKKVARPVAVPAPAKVDTDVPWNRPSARPSLATEAVAVKPAASQPQVGPPVPQAAAPVPPPLSGLIQSVPGVAAEQPVVVPPVAAAAPPVISSAPAAANSEVDFATRASVRRAPRDRWQLTGEDGTQIGLSGQVLVGRAPEAREHPGARAVPVEDPERSISKTHAMFTVEGDRLEVEDWASTNGVTVTRDGQEKELAPRVRTQLEPGDQVALGDRVFTVESIG